MDLSLVLDQEGIAHQLRGVGYEHWALHIEDKDAGRAEMAVAAFERENPLEVRRPEPVGSTTGAVVCGLVFFLALLTMYVWTGPDSAGSPWFARGSANQGEPAESGPVQTYMVSSARKNTRPHTTAPVVEPTGSGRRTSSGFSRSNAATAISARPASWSSICSAQCSYPTPRSWWAMPSWSSTSERSIARRKSLQPRRSTRAAYTAWSLICLLY